MLGVNKNTHLDEQNCSKFTMKQRKSRFNFIFGTIIL